MCTFDICLPFNVPFYYSRMSYKLYVLYTQHVYLQYTGTRSKTGHLLEFKKGPFHVWEHLQAPIIPMMIYGAYELFPAGANMMTPGMKYI